MSNTPPESGSVPRNPSRRHLRLPVPTLRYIELGNDNGGIILNVGEGGVAIASAVALENEELPSVRFRLPGSGDWIETSGRVAWTSPSRKAAGVRFVHLKEDDRNRIKAWISSEVSLAANQPSTRIPSEPETDLQHSLSVVREAKGLPPILVTSKSATSPVVEPPVSDPKPTVAASDAREPLESSQAAAHPFHSSSRLAVGDISYPTESPAPREGRLRFWLKSITLVTLIAIGSFWLGIAAGRNVWEKMVGFISGQARNASGETNPVETTPPPPSSVYTSRPNSATTPSVPSPVVEETQPPAQLTERRPTSANEGATKANKPPARSVESRPVQPAQRFHAPVDIPDHARDSTRGALPSATPPPTPTVIPPAPPLASSASSPPANGNEGSPPATSPGGRPASVTGSVEVISNPYPSLRMSPGLKSKASGPGISLKIGPVVSRVEPIYPPEALRQQVEGTVKLHAIIGRDGSVDTIELASGPQILANAARSAVQQWRYQQTFLAGEPVETEEDITVVFRLSDPAASAK